MQTVEVNLRLPSFTLRTPDQPNRIIDNASVRFKKLVELPAIPKPETSLTLTTAAGGTFEATVTRSDWNEERSRFIVSCTYAKRAISSAEYEAFVNDPDWTMKPLL